MGFTWEALPGAGCCFLLFTLIVITVSPEVVASDLTSSFLLPKLVIEGRLLLHKDPLC